MGAISDGIINILGTCSIQQVLNAVIMVNIIPVTYLHTLGTRTEKSFGNKAMHVRAQLFAVEGNSYAAVTVT